MPNPPRFPYRPLEEGDDSWPADFLAGEDDPNGVMNPLPKEEDASHNPYGFMVPNNLVVPASHHPGIVPRNIHPQSHATPLLGAGICYPNTNYGIQTPIPGYRVAAFPQPDSPTNVPAAPNNYAGDPMHNPNPWDLPLQAPRIADPPIRPAAAEIGIRRAPSQPTNHLRCGWTGCTYTGSFTREADLWRHIKSRHVAPGAFHCRSCDKRFNRAYNQRSHMRARHPGITQA